MVMILMIGLMLFGASFLVVCCFLDRSEAGLRSAEARGQRLPELSDCSHQQTARVRDVRPVRSQKAA